MEGPLLSSLSLPAVLCREPTLKLRAPLVPVAVVVVLVEDVVLVA
jgi:hypothetical protein